MIDDFIFITEPKYFDDIKEYLKKMHGLVKARPEFSIPCIESDDFLNKYLVLENENRIGVFRVRFNEQHPEAGPHLFWRYYGNRLLMKKTMLEDPMKRIGRATYEQFNGIFRVLLCTGEPVDPKNFFA